MTAHHPSVPSKAWRELVLLLALVLPLSALAWVTVRWEALTLPAVVLVLWWRKWIAAIRVLVVWRGDGD